MLWTLNLNSLQIRLTCFRFLLKHWVCSTNKNKKKVTISFSRTDENILFPQKHWDRGMRKQTAQSNACSGVHNAISSASLLWPAEEFCIMHLSFLDLSSVTASCFLDNKELLFLAAYFPIMKYPYVSSQTKDFDKLRQVNPKNWV